MLEYIKYQELCKTIVIRCDKDDRSFVETKLTVGCLAWG